MTADIDLTAINHTSHDSRMSYNGNVQHVIFFSNGYGASVIRGAHTYGGADGLWELAVLAGASNDWKITYETPITEDVLGHLTLDEVRSTLDAISNLPPTKRTDDE